MVADRLRAGLTLDDAIEETLQATGLVRPGVEGFRDIVAGRSGGRRPKGADSAAPVLSSEKASGRTDPPSEAAVIQDNAPGRCVRRFDR